MFKNSGKPPQKILASGVVLSMLIWGFSWPSGKVLTHYFSPINIAIYRYAIVFVSLLLVLAVLRQPLRIRKSGWWRVALSGAVLAFYTWLFFQGLKVGAAGAGGVLCTVLSPVIAYAIGIVQRRRLPGRNAMLGLCLGLVAGFVLLKVWDNPANLLVQGNVYFLLAAFMWAVLGKITAKGSLTGSPLSFSLWQYLFTFFCLLPLINVPELKATLHTTDPIFWGNIFFSSVVVTTLATTIFFYATTRLGAERASSFIFIVPFGAALSSWVLLGERLHLHTAIGGLLGIAAVISINRGTTGHNKRA